MSLYISRQPIFDRHLAVYSYELLYQLDQNNSDLDNDVDVKKAALTINSFHNINFDVLARNRMAFLNMSKPLIDQGAALLLPRARLVVEAGGDVVPDEITIESCSLLKKQGYKLALDDYSLKSKAQALLELADFIKIDFYKTAQEDQQLILDLVKSKGKKMIAKQVTNSIDYQKAINLGYDYFQGGFFSGPDNLNGKDIPTLKFHQVQLLKELHKAEIDFDRVELLIRQDLALSYKLLKYINSMEFELSFPISNIRQALTLLGHKKMIKWIAVAVLHSISLVQSNELLVTAVARAHFCEEMARQTVHKARSEDLFLAGLFSLLDAFLKRPMGDIVNELPLSPDINAALLGENSVLAPVLKLVLAYERADWPEVVRAKNLLMLNSITIFNSYLAALRKADLFAG